MNCPACGRDVTGKKFCPICGRPVEQEAKAPVFVQSHESKSEPEIQPKIAEQFSYVSKPINLPQKQETENSSKKVLMVIICIVVALAIVFAGALAFLSVYNSGGEDAPQKETVTEDVKPKSQKEEKEQIPAQPDFPRKSTYNSGYTYNNMEEIHSSKETDDAKAFEVKDVVTNFNNSWVEYVNSGDSSVFSYLRADTQAYKYAVAYGAKDIHEEYILMEVNDVREVGDSYYVWTHEIIEETSTANSSESERFEYHWVYKVSYSDGGYYIENYISDPAYK